MSTPDVRNVLRVPGRLSIDPTSVSSGSYPWGGTGLGVHTDIVAEPRSTVVHVPAEEYGMAPVEAIRCGEKWRITARLSSMDPDAIAKLFPGAGTGTVTGHPTISGPSGVGGVVSGSSCKLLFTPEDLDRHPMVLFYKAFVQVTPDGAMPFRADERWGVPVQWDATYDASKRLYMVARRQDLTL